MSERSIEITVEAGSANMIRNMLERFRNKAPSALKNAVNMTARKTRKNLPNYVQERYIIKTSSLKKNINLKKTASVSSPEAIISVKGKPIQLIYFQTRKHGKRTAAKAMGRVDKSLKEIISSTTGAKAFITTISNGTDENGKPKKGHRAIVQRLTKERYPLVTFAGPSAPVMLGNSETFRNIKSDIQKELMKNIDKQIQRIKRGGR